MTTHRSDIEGLRGIAILLVVLFHAGISAFAGAFIGVDVFFVISGFFITPPLVREVVNTGRIDFAAFLAKRALRLLPLLFIVVLATLALVHTLYAPIDRSAIDRDAIAVAFGAGNIAFAMASVNYFSARVNPLLHTWSLGVEQQFYLLWPLAIVAMAAIARRLGSRSTAASGATGPSMAVATTDGRTVRALVIGIAALGIASLVACIAITTTSPNWAFFGVLTRVWEFALGGLVALAFGERGLAGPATVNGAGAPVAAAGDGTMPSDAAMTSRRANTFVWIQAIGLAAIAIATLLYSRRIAYPGVAALVPAIAAALLLAGGPAGANTGIGRVLSASPLQTLGRLSYGWYLWHWPLIVTVDAVFPFAGVVHRLAAAVVALGLAWVTYHAIERPARAHYSAARPPDRAPLVPVMWVPAAAMCAAALVALVASGARSASERLVRSPAQRVFAQAREDRMRHDCWSNGIDPLPGTCAFGDTRANNTVVLLGDSHAEHWLGALEAVGRARGLRIVAMVKGGCPVVTLDGPSESPPSARWRDCTVYREATLDRIVAMRPAAVILSSWDHYVPIRGAVTEHHTTPEIWEAGLRRTYGRLARAGIPMIAIRGTPRTWFDVPACLSRREARLPFAGDCTYDRTDALSRVAYDAQTRAATGLPVRFIDMNDQICPTATCSPVQRGTIVFTDDNHLTASFSRTMAPVLSRRLGEITGRPPTVVRSVDQVRAVGLH